VSDTGREGQGYAIDSGEHVIHATLHLFHLSHWKAWRIHAIHPAGGQQVTRSNVGVGGLVINKDDGTGEAI